MNELCSFRCFSYTSQFFNNHDSHQSKLAELLEWCKIVQSCLNSGQINEAKLFLAQAIIDAEKPIKN